jgi:hypothetical protein
MAAFSFDVSYTESRNRLTTAFRMILAIPHLIVSGVWGYFAELLAFIQWFIILFTGKRNQGLWDLQYAYLGYYARVTSYTSLLFDEYPAFGTAPGPAPVSTHLPYEEPANRLTNGLRLIWAIPALIIGIGIGIAAAVVVLVSWFAILFTGRHSRGMFDFILKATRFTLQLNTYLLLMTDTYPKWGDQPAVPAPAGPGQLPSQPWSQAPPSQPSWAPQPQQPPQPQQQEWGQPGAAPQPPTRPPSQPGQPLPPPTG